MYFSWSEHKLQYSLFFTVLNGLSLLIKCLFDTSINLWYCKFMPYLLQFDFVILLFEVNWLPLLIILLILLVTILNNVFCFVLCLLKISAFYLFIESVISVGFFDVTLIFKYFCLLMNFLFSRSGLFWGDENDNLFK